jgi:hypothetical protein
MDRILMAVQFGTCILLVSWSHLWCREMLFGEVFKPKTIVSLSVRGILKGIRNKLLWECTKISV